MRQDLIKRINTADLEKAALNLQEVMGCYDPPISIDVTREKLIDHICSAAGLVLPAFDKLEFNTWKVLYYLTDIYPVDFPIENFLKMKSKTKKQKKTVFGTIHRYLRNKKWSTREDIVRIVSGRFPYSNERYINKQVDYFLTVYTPKHFTLHEKDGRYYVEDTNGKI